MATYYVDPSATGANNGSSWNDAWTSLQCAADTAAAGDTVYCRGTQTLTAAIDFDTNSGHINSGWIKFIGCNSAGNVDGTRFVLDANNSATSCILITGQNYIWFENLEFKNATGDGFDGTGDYHVLINCYSHNNGGCGFDLKIDFSYLFRCNAINNTNHGFENPGSETKFFFCGATGNGNDGLKGIMAYYGVSIIGCLFHDNGDNDKQVEQLGLHSFIFNSIFDGTDQNNETGYFAGYLYKNISILGCRFTNLASGLDANNFMVLYGWNYFHNNTNDTPNNGLLIPIPYNTATDTNQADVDADDGYNDVANDDFNIKENRTLRRTEIDLNIGS